MEAALIREEMYADSEAARLRFLPVVLPGCSRDDIPVVWMGGRPVPTILLPKHPGAQALLRYLTGQTPVKELPPIGTSAPGSTASGLRTEVALRAEITGCGILTVTTQVAGRPIGYREGPVPGALSGAWETLELSAAAVARDRLDAAGRALGGALLDDESARVVGELVGRLLPGDGVDVVLQASGAALGLPIELLRLPGPSGVGLGPLALQAGVSMRRQVVSAPLAGQRARPGPLKILAAVSSTGETRTPNPPLDVEAEMRMVLNATDAALSAHPAMVAVEIMIFGEWEPTKSNVLRVELDD